MTGRSPDGSGSRASHEAANASSPKASIPNAEALAEALTLVALRPYREVAEETAAEMEARLPTDVRGSLSESHIVFGTACAHQAAERLAELDAVFGLRWKADMRAIKRWQDATGRRLTWPDHADLVVWLLEQLDAAQEREAGAANMLDSIDAVGGKITVKFPKGSAQ